MLMIILFFTLIVLFIMTVLLWRFYQDNQRFFKQSIHFNFKNAGNRPYNLQRDTSFSQHIIRHSAVCENAMHTNHG